MDRNGYLQIAKPGTDLWAAVGVSMGLFGVITHVTFRLPELRLVEGSESSLLGTDKEGHRKLEESLESNEYMRVNWFTQKEEWHKQQWVGKQTSNGDIPPYHSILSCTLTAGKAHCPENVQLCLAKAAANGVGLSRHEKKFCVNLYRLESRSSFSRSGLRLYPWTTRLTRIPSSKWISQRSGCLSTGVKPSWTNSSNCLRIIRKPPLPLPLRSTAPRSLHSG